MKDLLTIAYKLKDEKEFAYEMICAEIKSEISKLNSKELAKHLNRAAFNPATKQYEITLGFDVG